jgi:ketosteroid isomerase-like protein
MGDEEQVLAANAEFYRAFAARDTAAMYALWAVRTPVACIHPGWRALRGREAVLASWRDILGGAGAPAIRCADAAAHVLGDAAFVTCTERLPGVELVATNLFVREDGAWKMVHHHASGMARDVAEPDDDEPESGSGLLH